MEKSPKSYLSEKPNTGDPGISNPKLPDSDRLNAGAGRIGSVYTLGSPHFEEIGAPQAEWAPLGKRGVDSAIRMVDADKHPLILPKGEDLR